MLAQRAGRVEGGGTGVGLLNIERRLHAVYGKAATLAEIEAQGWSLNPGRYVGVAPGEEISDEAIDGPSSVVLDQAENRLYVQQALLVELLTTREG